MTQQSRDCEETLNSGHVMEKQGKQINDGWDAVDLHCISPNWDDWAHQQERGIALGGGPNGGVEKMAALGLQSLEAC